MANFAYLPQRGSLAKWATGTVVTGAEFWFFEESIVKCPNFADGGTYAPVAQVVVGGAGMTVSGPFTASSATSITVTTLTLASGGTATLTGNTTVGGTFTFNNVVQLNYPATLYAPLSMGSGGKIQKRRLTVTTGLPADNIVASSSYDYVFSGTTSFPDGGGIRLSAAPYTNYEMTVCNISAGSMTVQLSSDAASVSLAPNTTALFLSQVAAPGWILVGTFSNTLA